MMEIKDLNKRISELMGATIIEVYLKPDKTIDHYLMDMGQDRLVNSRYIANTTMEYHKSWEWLMPVVKKIKSLPIDKYDYDKYAPIHFYLKTVDIKGVYDAINYFLDWYEKFNVSLTETN